MGSGPICAMVWEGREACKIGRQILGATNPKDSAPGTIRGDYAIVRPPKKPLPCAERYLYSTRRWEGFGKKIKC